MAILTEVNRRCRGQESARSAYFHRMATNGVEALGANVPDVEAPDELRREEKVKRIEAVTQKPPW
jgi:hypothetical protein